MSIKSQKAGFSECPPYKGFNHFWTLTFLYDLSFEVVLVVMLSLLISITYIFEFKDIFMKYDYIIVGSGLFGATFAHLAQTTVR